MNAFTRWLARQGSSAALAATALRSWGAKQVAVAIATGAATAVLIGVATVLIPNSVFSREIPRCGGTTRCGSSPR